MENARRPSIRHTRYVALRQAAGRACVLGGAAAFAASLGCFTYVYGVRLGAVSPTPTPLGVVGGLAVDTGLFSLFALHHSLLARSGARRWIAGHLPEGLERATYIWIASLLFALTCAGWQPLPGALYHMEGVLRAGGFAVQAAGVILVLRAGAVLDLAELVGIRQPASLHGDSGGQASELRIRGPYRRLRHPLYTGLILVLFGTPDMTCSRLWFALLSTAYIVVAIPWEERDMAVRFGARYDRYRTSVPWRLVPGVY